LNFHSRQLEIGVEIVYNATGRNKTSVHYASNARMITSLKINDGSIGNNLTVQVGPLVSNRSLHSNNWSDPITLGMNAVIIIYTLHTTMHVLHLPLHFMMTNLIPC